MKNGQTHSAENASIIYAFSGIAGIFFSVYAGYYFWYGDYYLGTIYAAICVAVFGSLLLFRSTRNEPIALGVLASLGLPVLIPWQINGGIGMAGLFWYYIYIIWLFFLLGRTKGLVCIIGVFIISVGEYVLQYMGHLPSLYSLETMLSFYFGFILEAAVLYISQSAKEKTDSQLANERTKLQGILDNMSEGLVAADLSGKIIFFNKAAKDMGGIGVSRHDPKRWQKVYGVYQPDKMTPIRVEDFPLSRALKGETTHVEQYIKSKHGKKSLYILAKGSPLRDASGNISGGIAIFSDITEAKEAEAKLLTSKAKDEAILGSIGEGVVAVDRTGSILLFNYAAQVMSGVLRSEALGKPYKKILDFYNDKGELDTDFITNALAGKRSDLSRDGILVRKDRTTIAIANNATPIVDAQGAIDGAVIVFRDITRERQVEHMKDEFLAIASHELRTPMGAIRANLAMILSGDYGPVSKSLIEPLTDMKASTIRLVELVNDLLNVARIEAGRMVFTLSEFDMTEVAQGVVASLAPLGKEDSITISLTPGGAHTNVQGDIAKVKQVLTNLVGNSLKFTDKGSVTVTVRAKKDAVHVVVADTGVGIASDDQEMLFTKFNQVTPVNSTKPAGTGLGLYISREIIRKMGGDLWLEKSAIDKGSTFTFTLPRPGSPEAQKAKRAIAHETKRQPTQQEKK